MALKHDAQGFLVGDPIDLSKAVADWAAIRDDVRAIRQAVLGIESALNRDAPEARASVPATPGRGAGLEEADPTVKAFNEVAQPMARDARQGADTERAPQNPQAIPSRQALTGQPAKAARRERQIPVLLRAPAVPQTGGAGGNAARRDTESAAAVTRAVAELRATRQAVTRAPAQPMGRDSRGRFVRGAAAARPAAGGGRGAGAGGPTDGERDGQDESALRSLGDRIVGAFKESGAGLEEADPTVKAFNEVAQPMARGYELLTGGDSQKKQEGWLRRIYGSLTGFRKDEGLFNKVAAKRLKAIEEKPVAEAGGGGGLFGGLLGMLGGLLKRIPGVGALAASAGGLLARGGGLLAAAWTATTEAVMSAWNATVEGVKKGWDSVVSGFTAVGDGIGKAWGKFVDSAKAGWDAIAGLFSSAYEGLKSIPVIGPAIQAVEDAAKKTADAASAAATAAKQKAVEVGTKAIEKGKEVAQATKEKAVEVGAKAVEGAKAGVEYLGNNTTIGKGVKAAGEAVNYGVDVAVDTGRALKSKLTGQAGRNQQALMNQMAASGISDPTEQAMFMAQMDHESGGFTKMEERFNYRSADRLMAVSGSAKKQGKAAVEAAMAQGPEAVAELMYGGRMGNTEKGDAYKFRGRGHVQLTGKDNYAAAGKDLGLDLVNSPELAADPENAAKIAAWYWKKNPKLAAAGKAGNVEAATQAINGGQNGVEHRKELFAKYQADGVGAAESQAANQSPATAVARTTAPAAQPAPAVALAQVSAPAAPVGIVAPAAPVVAAVSVPTVPAAPVVPPIADAPPVAVPMAGADARKPVAVVSQPAEVGQDLRERGIAHIATGGLGGA